ncbi:MAG: proton-conducting transporter membrane subunit [Gammaproteobacteria bacterium]
MRPETALQLAVFLPALAAVPIVLAGRWPNLRETVTLLAAGATCLLVVSLLPGVLAGDRPTVVLTEMFPGLPLVFSLEPLGMIFALVASFLWIVTTVYAVGYMRSHGEHDQTRFYAAFAVSIAAALAVAFAGNLITLFVAYEVLSLATYPLVTHAGTPEAKRAGRVYLGILMSTSIGLQLLAIVWTWTLTGSVDFTDGGILAGRADGPIAAALLALYVFGIAKAAVMPFHRWLPAAMVAPTPVSALLHAVAVVKSGVFAILKICVYIFGLDFLAGLSAADWLLGVATFTILAASVVAITRDNLKARLAYSTISQLSYIVAGALLATSLAVTGAAMHIAMHAFGKITLFFCAGAFLVAAHRSRVSQLDGLGRHMPWTMAAFLVGSLSIIGLPPAGGTWSKFFLMLGALEADKLWIAGVLVASSLMNIWYLLEIPVRGFFVTAKEEIHAGEAPWPMLLAMVVTSLGCLALFLWPDTLYRLAADIAGGAADWRILK